MMALLNKLNLRPQEKRLLAAVAIVLFLVLNAVFVKPHFNDWTTLQGALLKSQEKLAIYQTETGKIPSYQSRLARLEGAGSAVPAEDQANNLVSAITSQAVNSKVITTRVAPKITPRTGLGTASNTATNQFFEEQTVYVGIANTGDKELVDFLIALSSSDLMVRVRDLDVRPDPSSNNSKLTGTLTLVASYQKNSKKAATPARRPKS